MEHNVLGESCRTEISYVTRDYSKPGIPSEAGWLVYPIIPASEREMEVTHYRGFQPACDHEMVKLRSDKKREGRKGAHCECPRGFTRVGWERARRLEEAELIFQTFYPVCLQD